MPIAQKRMDRAVAHLYDLVDAGNYGMGLAITKAASEYQIPQRHLRDELQRRKAEKAAEKERQRARAAKRSAWWMDI